MIKWVALLNKNEVITVINKFLAGINHLINLNRWSVIKKVFKSRRWLSLKNQLLRFFCNFLLSWISYAYFFGDFYLHFFRNNSTILVWIHQMYLLLICIENGKKRTPSAKLPTASFFVYSTFCVCDNSI